MTRRNQRRPQRSKAMRSITRAVALLGAVDGANSRAYRIAMNQYEQGVHR